MTRHPFASGFVISWVLAATAGAQVYQDQATPRAPVSQLRPGWGQEGIDPAAARARYVVAPAPVQLVDDNETSHSFLPNWFGWGYNKPQQQLSNSRSNQQRQYPSKQNGSQQGMQRGDADSTPPDPASMQDSQLPGLGGTALPRSRNQSAGSGQDTRPNGSSSSAPSHSVQNHKLSAAGGTNPRMASREPLNPPSDPTLGDSAPSTIRNSPGRRTAPHITPDELRRELSGTFPTPAAKSESSSMTASRSESEGDASLSEVPAASSPSAAAKESAQGLLSKPSRHEGMQGWGVTAEPSRSAAEAFGSCATLAVGLRLEQFGSYPFYERADSHRRENSR